jgi:hypothetical protein
MAVDLFLEGTQDLHPWIRGGSSGGGGGGSQRHFLTRILDL